MIRISAATDVNTDHAEPIPLSSHSELVNSPVRESAATDVNTDHHADAEFLCSELVRCSVELVQTELDSAADVSLLSLLKSLSVMLSVLLMKHLIVMITIITL